MQVPLSQSLASGLVVNPTCKPGNGSTELGETRIQAALSSLEIGIIVVVRITSIERSERGKADALHAAEGSSPELRKKVSRQDTTGVLERGMYLRG